MFDFSKTGTGLVMENPQVVFVNGRGEPFVAYVNEYPLGSGKRNAHIRSLYQDAKGNWLPGKGVSFPVEEIGNVVLKLAERFVTEVEATEPVAEAAGDAYPGDVKPGRDSNREIYSEPAVAKKPAAASSKRPAAKAAAAKAPTITSKTAVHIITKREYDRRDRRIEQLYYKHCPGATISVLDIPPVFKHGHDAIALNPDITDDQLAKVIKRYVDTIRKDKAPKGKHKPVVYPSRIDQ